MKGFEKEVLAQQPVSGLLRTAREMLGWTQQQAAEQFRAFLIDKGYRFHPNSATHISRLERGASYRALVLYAEFLAGSLPEDADAVQTHVEEPEEPTLASPGERGMLVLETVAKLAYELTDIDRTRKLLGKYRKWRRETVGHFFRPSDGSVTNQLAIAEAWLREIAQHIRDDARLEAS